MDEATARTIIVFFAVLCYGLASYYLGFRAGKRFAHAKIKDFFVGYNSD